MKRLLALAFAALLLAPLALAEEGKDASSGKNGSDERKDRPEARGSERRSEGAERSIGAFSVDKYAQVTGAFVAFTYSSAGVSNVTAGGLPLFSALAFGGATGTTLGTRVESKGSLFLLRGPGFEMRAHDNPTATFRFDSSATMRFLFPTGASVSQLADGRVLVTFADGRTGRVFGENLSVGSGFVSGRGNLMFLLDAAKGLFDAHREDIAKAITKREVGAEITVGKDNRTGDVREDVVEYGNVSVRSLAQIGNVTLVLSGHGFDGRVIVVNLDPALFGAPSEDGYLVRFDNASIHKATDLADVLDPDNDGLQAEYLVVRSSDGVQVIVSVPHYSVHTLTILGVSVEVTPSIVLGLAASAIVVAAGYAVLFRAPKRRDL